MNSYTITGSIDNNGQVDNNNQTVKYNNTSQAMTFRPAGNYKITGISINGVAMSADAVSTALNSDGTYTFAAIEKVTNNWNVEVTTAENVTLTFYNSDGNNPVVVKTGLRGTAFQSGETYTISFTNAKLLAQKYAESSSGSEALKQSVSKTTSLEDLSNIGFTYTFDGWCNEANSGVDGGTVMVAKGSDSAGLDVTYSVTTATGSMFKGNQEKVYAHYDMAYNPATPVTLNTSTTPILTKTVTGTGFDAKTFDFTLAAVDDAPIDRKSVV